MTYLVSVDIGGTFTDLVAIDAHSREVRVVKIRSQPEDPVRSVTEALREADISAEAVDLFLHGTTVLTNALIERKGPQTGFVTNSGFKGIVFVHRGDKKYLYNLHWKKPKPLVKRRNCVEVACRVDSRGTVVLDLCEDNAERAIQQLKDSGIQAIAVCFLFSYLNPIHELQMAEVIKKVYPEADVSLSHQVYPRWKEYERASTTIADVYLKGLFRRYLTNLSSGISRLGIRAPFFIMKSNGGVMNFRTAAAQPSDSIMSGPVGGVIGGKVFGQLAGASSIITIDIGGTSSDVCLIEGGSYDYSDEYEIDWGIPVKSPMVAIKAIGAGGGSIAWMDEGGLLQVGPQSAGATPGPACYEQGGALPTVTDANLYLGRLNPNYFCAGAIRLDSRRAEEALVGLAHQLSFDALRVAESTVAIANHNMANAIRLVSVERGIDPRRFSLVAFGGAGGLHAARIAEILGIRQVVVPLYPGHTSALGLQCADLRVDSFSTILMTSDTVNLDKLNELLGRLRNNAENELLAEGFHGGVEMRQKMEMRYLGQNYHKEIDLPDRPFLTAENVVSAFRDFHEKHKELHGYANPEDTIEIVGMAVTLIGKRPSLKVPAVSSRRAMIKGQRMVYFGREIGWLECRLFERRNLPSGFQVEGPIIVEEPYSTTVVYPQQVLSVDTYGNLIISLG